MPELSRQVRAAETKKRRTRERFIAAADKQIGERGWDVTVDDVCSNAGMSPASFYTVFPGGKGDMFAEVFRELVLPAVSEPVGLLQKAETVAETNKSLGYDDNLIELSVRAYLMALQQATKGRETLVRGVLAARINAFAVDRNKVEWYRGDPSGDVVLDLATSLARLVEMTQFSHYPEWDHSVSRQSMNHVTPAIVLAALDDLSSNRPPPHIYGFMISSLFIAERESERTGQYFLSGAPKKRN
jgi:AcrR family transcriptional regulator